MAVSKEFTTCGNPPIEKRVENAVTRLRTPVEIESNDERWHVYRRRADEFMRLKDGFREAFPRDWEEPYLVLNKDRVTFFGVSMSRKKIGGTPFACLWVLAENRGEPTTWATLVEEGGLKNYRDSGADLSEPFSRLRGNLRDMYARSRDVTRPALPDDCYIENLRGCEYSHGKYRLALDRSRVWREGSRPRGMKQPPRR